MDFLPFIICISAFGLSFLFALGGVGSAVALIPALTWFGVPFVQARSIGLFVNTVGMVGATYANIRKKNLDYALGLPIIITSIVMAPAGAWIGHLLPARAVMVSFIVFLFFSGTMMLFFRGSRYADQYRDDRPVLLPLLIGTLAGFISGLLGVGGGGVVAPLMILRGFNPKRVAAITAFSVPFSSFSAFLAYAAMGSVSWTLLLIAGCAAWAGGYIGTIVMQKRMKPQTVKKFLGAVILLIAVKLISGLF